MINQNPLRQHFRRPAIYIKLPSGGVGYPSDALDLPETGELPVYPMTAIDEITSKTTDALFNGQAFVSIVQSCIPNIKNPWVIPSTDIDTINVALRAATTGNDLEIHSTCPKCSEESKYGIDLVGLLSRMRPGDYDRPLKIRDLSIKFRPLNYKEMNDNNRVQFEIQKMVQNVNESIDDVDRREKIMSDAMIRISDMSMEIISNLIQSITTPEVEVTEREYILDFLRNCDRATFEAIKAYNIKLRESSEIPQLDIKCVNCTHEYKQDLILNLSDFFA